MDNHGFDTNNDVHENGHLGLNLTEIQNGNTRTEMAVDVIKSDGEPRRRNVQQEIEDGLVYKVDDVPPWYMTLFLGFQHYLTMVGPTVACPFFLTPALCMADDDPDRANIISTLIFVSGFITIMQCTWGTRLPIVQGGSFSFLIPALSVMNLPRWKCPEMEGWTDEEKTEEWQKRMREVQGAIIVASLVEVLLGFCGVISAVLRYITPLTVAPVIILIGLALIKEAAAECAKNWWISSATMILLIIFSQYLRNVQIPVPCSRSPQRDNKRMRFPLFQVFPILLMLIIVWSLCAILTVTGVLPEGDLARTDIKIKIFQQSPWFRVPYPFQWGWPTVSIGAVLGILSGVIASAIESIGCYYSCARISGMTAPPTHAMSRGIFTDGFGCVLSGIWGSGNGSTAYSNNVGAISITKVASRRVIQVSGIIMIVLSLIGKAGAVFVGLPDPIIGGMFCFIFAIVMAVGLSNLQSVDFNSSRNIFIIGFSVFFALAISEWIKVHPIVTGHDNLDQILQILLTTGMFIAGVLGFVFDNTISGTLEERGLADWSAESTQARKLETGEQGNQTSCRDPAYDFPYLMDAVQRSKWMRWLPISPTYEANFMGLLFRKKSKLNING